jgi:tetrahydromethanopterin S-methyltransferase subunit F
MEMKSHDWHKGWRIGFICGMVLAWVFVFLGHITA